jgi:membrane AbrB-like protein
LSRYEEAEDRPDRPETRPLKQRIPLMIGTLLWGVVGGWLFSLAGIPLAWMIGSMLFTAGLAVAGVRLTGPGKSRAGMIAVLGVMLGSAFTPDVLGQAANWIVSIVVLLVFVIVVTVVLAWGFQKYGGLEKREAILSATPGGFGEMILIAESYGADVRSISLIHATRVMFTVMLIPLYFRFFEGYVPPDVSPMGSMGELAINDGFILLCCALVGYFGARRLKVPAAALLGPMLVSAVVHFLGFTKAQPPGELVNLAQIVIGTNVGCRFVGVKRQQLINPVGIGVIGAVITLGLAMAAAAGLNALTSLDKYALWIAFAPGGLAEMTLISLAMQLDVAFVSTHHIVRILFIVSAIGIVSRLLFGPPKYDG